MISEFYYDNQIKKYLLQFNAIFQDMQVQVGKNDTRDEQLIPVPIVIGSMDRVAAAAATGHTQNKHIRLPMMSSNISGFEIARDRFKGIGMEQREVYLPLGGALPHDARVVRQRMAIPYRLTVDLMVYTSNKDQQFQIMEQIMMLFDPAIQIQTTDSAIDPSRITTVELTMISSEDNFPPGTESRNSMITFTFTVDAYIQIPATVKQDYVKRIIARVSAVDGGDIGTIHSDGRGNSAIGPMYDQMDVEGILLQDADIGEDNFIPE